MAEAAGPESEAEKTESVCPRCGVLLKAWHCRMRCPNCGFEMDCSDVDLPL